VRPIYGTGLPLPPPPPVLHFIYIFFSLYISAEYFKHAAHSPFFSSKCRLFHNSTFLFLLLFTFYIQNVLKFKSKTLRCQKVKNGIPEYQLSCAEGKKIPSSSAEATVSLMMFQDLCLAQLLYRHTSTGCCSENIREVTRDR
jgi:hypothetical protein